MFNNKTGFVDELENSISNEKVHMEFLVSPILIEKNNRGIDVIKFLR
ncbi:hypothetical protein BAOM_3920 [Peribacillus asahii]|uniref:Uncharacterized protein n=1 Tax=Peribacillus asahii TaxID=228899 RepID=A0A3Q9RQH4_9BACI|nr:hypothetical protein BAOM_3920 [Peribacillus asahii]